MRFEPTPRPTARDSAWFGTGNALKEIAWAEAEAVIEDNKKTP